MTQDGIQANELRRFLKPFVAMVVQEVAPRKDELSANQAYKDYGRRWIDAKTESGDLTPRYVNQRKLYSKAQIETLKAVESVPASITVKSPSVKRGRPRKNPEQMPFTAEPKRKRGRPRKVQTDTSDIIPL